MMDQARYLLNTTCCSHGGNYSINSSISHNPETNNPTETEGPSNLSKRTSA